MAVVFFPFFLCRPRIWQCRHLARPTDPSRRGKSRLDHLWVRATLPCICWTVRSKMRMPGMDRGEQAGLSCWQLWCWPVLARFTFSKCGSPASHSLNVLPSFPSPHLMNLAASSQSICTACRQTLPFSALFSDTAKVGNLDCFVLFLEECDFF